jgi:tripartite-type tricarboxylate transporter receptor subunit TctC
LLICISVVFATGCSRTTSGQGTASATQSAVKADEPFKFSKIITIILPYDAGSSLDRYAQVLRVVLGRYAGVTVLVEYKPGGNTSIGMNYLLTQPNDGHTVAFNSNVVEVSIATEQVNFTDKDLIGIGNLGGETSVVYVAANSPFKTFNEFLSYAKVNPGAVKWGATGTLSWQHIFILQLMQKAQINMNYISYANSPEGIAAILGGNIDISSSSFSALLPYGESGQIRYLAHGMHEPQKDLPGIPSIFDSEGLSYEMFGNVPWLTTKAFYMRADTPESVLKAWDELLSKAAKDQEWIDFLVSNKCIVETIMDRPTFQKYVKDTTDRYREVYAALE